MALLYLIRAKCHAVAIIQAKDALEAISTYLERIGFDSDYKYFCSHLMTNATTTDTTAHHKHCFAETETKTIGGDFIKIRSQLVASCDSIFSWANPNDINSPLFIRPTIKEVRKCVGFRKTPIHELRKFCI